MSWNLLALCISSKKKYEEASQICEAGYKQIVSSLMNDFISVNNTFTWNLVDFRTKDELIKFDFLTKV